MASLTVNKLCSVSLLLVIGLCLSYIAEASTEGFTVDLIHRDSPRSPLYNAFESRFDRLRNAAVRSSSRLNHFNPSASISSYGPSPSPQRAGSPQKAATPQQAGPPQQAWSPSSGGGAETLVKSGGGEYIMNISIGTPPFQIHAIVDTGSDLVWTQCQPCLNCYDQIDPIFAPQNSSTYRNLSCQSTPCTALGGLATCGSQSHCVYAYGYGDGSFTAGNLASETITLGSSGGRPVPLPTVSFGCGHKNAGTFQDTASGIIGLGGGPLSLVSQLGPTASGRFSYCLVPWDDQKNTSKIRFGSDAVVSGDGVVSTPLVAKDPATFYYLTLEAISVGDKKLPFSTSGSAVEGNIVIDSGTTVNILPSQLYDDLVDTLVGAITGNRTEDTSGTFDLCYVSSGEDSTVFPDITAHFEGGADVVLNPFNTFVEVDDGVVCLAMISAEGDIAIFGNLSQMNFLIGYDLEARTVSFKPTECTMAA